MTESSLHMAAAIPALVAESFWSVLIRRGRYVAGIGLSAVAFSFIGWQFVAPPPEMAGVSLLGWPAWGGMLSAAGLLALLLIVGFICTALVHPDAPHMGLFCAIAGMAALSIRGGTAHTLIQSAQISNTYSAVSKSLAVECLLWAGILLVTETVLRMSHDRFFANTHWITRSGAELSDHALKPFSKNGGSPMGVSLAVSQTLGTHKLNRAIATPMAMIYSGVVAFLLLYILLHTQLKGQVLFACFAAFFLSTGNAYLAFPRVPALGFFLAVLLTASFGYFVGSNAPTSLYPGQGGFFISRALPIDFFVAGIPGAILGYYSAVRWALHSDDQD